MNDKFGNIMKIVDKAKSFSMTKEEKEALMSSVTNFVKENPYVEEKVQPIVSPYTEEVPVLSSIFIFLKRHQVLVPVMLLVFMFSGGISSAANFALPGDVLYPVKIYVNEGFKSFVAFSASANAEVETAQATERLKETEKLAMKGSVDDKTKKEIGANFVAHAKKVKKISKDLRAKGDVVAAAKVDAEFKNVVDTNTAVIENIGVKAEVEQIDQEKEDNGEYNADDKKDETPVDLNINSSTDTEVSPVNPEVNPEDIN